MTTAQFTVDPSTGIKDIRAEVYSTNTGQRTVTADITYWPVGHKEMAEEIDGISFTYDVQEAMTPPAESTPTQDETATSNSANSTEANLLSNPIALIGALLVLVLVSIVGLVAKG